MWTTFMMFFLNGSVIMARLVKYKMRHAVLHSNKTGAVPPTAFAHLTALNRKGLLIH